jgi:hypothetical protein
VSDSSARSALTAGALAACVVGLLGVDAGLLWIIAGVFTLRSLAGAPPGLAWGFACVGAGLRWGTLGLGDLETATRLLGASVFAGGAVVRVAMGAALVGAVVDEARRGDLLGGSGVERSASIAAGVALVPTFLAAGPVGLGASSLPWAVGALAAVAAVVLLQPLARRVPWWAPTALVVAGAVAAEVAT